MRFRIIKCLILCVLILIIGIHAVINFELKDPWWLCLLIVPLTLAWFLEFRYNSYMGKINLSNTSNHSNVRTPIKLNTTKLIYDFIPLSLAFSIIALTRPLDDSIPESLTKEGIDIIITLDVSMSMLAKDFEPNRLEAAKKVAIDFINERVNDRVGIVTYAAESFPQVPLTADKFLLAKAIGSIEYGGLKDGTAIGLGLASSVNRLKDSESKSKAIILLSDGDNNSGNVDPITASELAKVYGVTVYTIGVGTKGPVLFPRRNGRGEIYYREVDASFDERTLYSISENTGGKYFRAESREELAAIYAEIDLLEKTKFESTVIKQKADIFWHYLILSLASVLMFILMKYVFFKSVFS